MHRCLGEALALAELEESLIALTQRIPQLRLAGAQPKFGDIRGCAASRECEWSGERQPANIGMGQLKIAQLALDPWQRLIALFAQCEVEGGPARRRSRWTPGVHVFAKSMGGPGGGFRRAIRQGSGEELPTPHQRTILTIPKTPCATMWQLSTILSRWLISLSDRAVTSKLLVAGSSPAGS